MERNGGFATLGFLYEHALREADVQWNTKTPFASIRRIVQDPRFFFKIKPGLWALKSHREKLPPELLVEFAPSRRREASDHSYYQGLILEIGNLKNFGTTIPAQDRNKAYLNRKLGDVATVKEFYPFTYDEVVKRARTIDVVWFNQRKMPSSCFEIEHSTDISNSLLKFVEIQDFHTNFLIVADKRRQGEFLQKMRYHAFSAISDRVRFLTYDELSNWHARTYQLHVVERQLQF